MNDDAGGADAANLNAGKRAATLFGIRLFPDRAIPSGLRLAGGGPVWVTRAATFGLFGLLAVAVIGGVTALAGGAPPAPAMSAAPVSTLPAEGFASRFVAAYLSSGADPEVLAGFLGWRAALPPGIVVAVRVVRQVTPLEVATVDAGYWAVTVAATVDGEPDSFWMVAVTETDGHLIAVSWPSQVGDPTPAGARPVPAVRAGERPPPGDAMAATVTGWLNAYLAGAGDLERYSAPGARLTPITPAPYVAVEITRWNSAVVDGQQLAAVEVVATNSAGAETPLAYTVRLAARDGRWEVSDLVRGPTPVQCCAVRVGVDVNAAVDADAGPAHHRLVQPTGQTRRNPMIQWATTKLTEIQTLIQLGIGVLVVFFIGKAFKETRALVPVATVAVLGGGVLWAIHHTGWFQDRVGEETNVGAPLDLGLPSMIGVTVDSATDTVVVTL